MVERRIELVEEAGSTNALALEALNAGVDAGYVLVADRQVAGRGRRRNGEGRKPWFSPGGLNLYMSVVLRPAVPVGKSAAITLAVGAQLVTWLRDHSAVEVALKWPNDLYVGPRKLGGILTEAVSGRQGLEGLVVGVGLNINVERDHFPDELRDRATSLREERGERLDRLSMVGPMSQAIVEAGQRFEDAGLTPFMEDLQAYDWLRGKPLWAEVDGREQRGVADGIGAQGGLMVSLEDGQRREIISGEVRWIDDESAQPGES